jgi:stearoyl-CoA desaturase (delta-9 desaturase)
MTQYFNLRMNNRKTTALYYMGMVGFVVALTQWDWELAAVALGVHLFVISLFSAVVHRYFCHRAYEANPTVMWLLAFIPVTYGYATPSGWASLHSAHHAFADTDKDTHIKGWIGLFTAAYRMPPLKFALAAKWFHGKGHEFLHKNAMGVVLAWLGVLALIGPKALIWVGLVPMFTLHFCNGLHRVFSHRGTTAKNRWYLEYICPMGGEWIHDEHHVNARKAIFANHWYEMDTGAFFVRLLARKEAA